MILILTNNHDKVQHFILNMIPAVIGYLLALAAVPVIPQAYEYRKASGLLLAGVAAYGKEVWDARHPDHTSDGLDFVSGMVGAVSVLEVLP